MTGSVKIRARQWSVVCFLMLCATIDRAVSSMAQDDNPPHIVLTGGDAPLVGPLLGYPVEQHPLLVLEGLRHLVAESGHA